MPSKTKYDIETVKTAAEGRWNDILEQVGGIDPDYLDGKHHPCPKCGGTDRFRFFDDGTGGVLCNQCFNQKNGDGIAAIQWCRDLKFQDAVAQVAEYLNVAPETNGKRKGKKEKPNPSEHLNFHEGINEMIAQLWCETKQPIVPSSLDRFGAKYATYRGQWQVFAIPILNNRFETCGWAMFNSSGKTLPKYQPGKPPEYVKIKLTYGSEQGIFAEPEKLKRLDEIHTIWKVEGLSDAMALSQIVPPDHLVVANSNGALERPQKWILELCTGKRVIVIHDCDRPGQDGATYVNEDTGKRAGWCPSLVAAGAAEVFNLVLPYPIGKDHGNDLRDWMNQGNAWSDLVDLCGKLEQFESDPEVSVIESNDTPDDPHRLALKFLNRRATKDGAHTIRYWRSEWFGWHGSHYRQIHPDEMRADIGAFLREEFVRANLEEMERSEGEEIPRTRHVTNGRISNTLMAIQAMTTVPFHIELNSWIEDDSFQKYERRNYISLQNGILDVDSLLAGEHDIMLEHSPKWFSTTSLPYPFDIDAECPTWMKFLHKNLEGDKQSIATVQEFTGYCLIPDTGMQTFMLMEGEGANGKSVYCAAIEAILGSDNCSHVSLEIFGDRFSRTQTLGKLLNISADAGELDKVAEGYLKSFVGGDKMYFDRKGISGIEIHPTARMLIACNNKPRWNDRSDAVFRRMILIPWTYKVKPEERVQNMDKSWWWEQSGELPGMLLWALAGLARLRQNQQFTISEKTEQAMSEYKSETNPARDFLLSTTEFDPEYPGVPCIQIYDMYRKWSKENGVMPLGSRSFGKEIRRVYPETKRVQKRSAAPTGDRFYVYEGIRETITQDDF